MSLSVNDVQRRVEHYACPRLCADPQPFSDVSGRVLCGRCACRFMRKTFLRLAPHPGDPMMTPLPKDVPVEALSIALDAARGHVPDKETAATALWNVAGFAAWQAIQFKSHPSAISAAVTRPEDTSLLKDTLQSLKNEKMKSHAAGGHLSGDFLKSIPWGLIGEALGGLLIKVLAG